MLENGMTIEPVQILLVEDNEDDIVLIQEALKDANMVNLMQIVRDGEEALMFLRREGQYQNAQRPGLILLDINMPKKNGFEVLDEVKQDPSLCSIPVVILTVSSRENEVARAYCSGACTFVRKPVKFDEFRKVVKQLSLYWALVATLPNGH